MRAFRFTVLTREVAMKRLLRGCLLAVAMGVLIGSNSAAWENPFDWRTGHYTAGDSLNGADSTYCGEMSIPTDGFYLYVDIDSAGSQTLTMDSIIIGLQTRPHNDADWAFTTYTSAVLSLRSTYTQLPFLKYFPADTMKVYGITEIVRPYFYGGPKDAAAESTLVGGTSGASALVLKFWYGGN
jgi:hypothetical protein